jgi:hypothetical protein
MLSNIHMMLLSMAFLAKPMFRVNKPLFILEQTMDVMWQNILPPSLNNIHVEK